jgi:hypothetical protein
MAKSEQAPPGPDEIRLGYETRDANTGRVFSVGFALLLLIVVVLVAMWGLLGFFSDRAPRPVNPPAAMLEQNVVPPEPRLQPNPAADLKAFLASEDSVLRSYAWVDKKKGIARIPIDSAMELALKKGFPVRPGTGEGK